MRYIIVDPEEGIFLGTRGDPDRRRIGMIFSSNNLFELRKACSWRTHAAAHDYLEHHIRHICPSAFIADVEVNNKNEFVDVIDIIKSGYGDYTFELFDAIPVENHTVH